MNDLTNGPPRTFHVAQMIACVPCGLLVPVLEGNPIADFLAGSGLVCKKCGKAIDIWHWMLDHFTNWGDIGTVPLGPILTNIQFDLPRHGRSTIRLVDHQVPADARILERRYCGQDHSDIFPLECHGGSPRGAPFFDGAITLYGATFPPGCEATPAEVSRQLLSISWVPAGMDVDAWSLIWTALEHFARHDYVGLIIPANTAVELVTDRVTTIFLNRVPGVSRTHLKAVEGDLTYDHRLNVLVPMIAWLAHAPALSDSLKEDLNILKSLRNQVGHTGRTTSNVKQAGAAKLIRACLFGFHYLQLVRAAIERKWPSPEERG